MAGLLVKGRKATVSPQHPPEALVRMTALGSALNVAESNVAVGWEVRAVFGGVFPLYLAQTGGAGASGSGTSVGARKQILKIAPGGTPTFCIPEDQPVVQLGGMLPSELWSRSQDARLR